MQFGGLHRIDEIPSHALNYLIMHEQLEEKARKKVEAKMAFYILAIIFAFVSLILMVMSFQIGNPKAGFWLRLPILIFPMVLAIMYIPIFGIPFSGVSGEEWQEREYQKELDKLYRQNRSNLPPPEDLSEEDRLELKELERLKRKWGDDEDYYV